MREYYTRYDEPISFGPEVDALIDEVRVVLAGRVTDESRWALLNAITDGWCMSCGGVDKPDYCYCTADD